MEIITGTEDFYLEVPTAVAMGKFDGVHVGHRRLLDEILEQKKNGLKACVFTFDPAPAVFFGYSDGRELTTGEEKRVLFERMGIDILIEFPMNTQTAGILPQAFVSEVLAGKMNAAFVAAGTDVSFGDKGAGNAALLRQMAVTCGYEVSLIDKVCMDGKEVSSTYVRETVEKGDMQLAEKLLGAPYEISGTVVHGRRLGRSLGIPTVNLLPAPAKLLPPAGVYFSRVTVQGRKYEGISNVGCKPTVSDEDGQMGVETYIYDFAEDVYDRQIQVELLWFCRAEMKFSSVEALQEQMHRDLESGRKYFGNWHK